MGDNSVVAPMANSPFNVVLAEARLERGLSRHQVARMAGFTPVFVASYEDVAINPTVRTLYKFARALGLRVVIDREGVTIIDAVTGAIRLERWNPEQ